MDFKPGDKVAHKLTKDYMLILSIDESKVTVRMKNYEVMEFALFEIEPIK